MLTGSEPQELVREFPVVSLDALLDVHVPSVTSEGFGHDPVRGELWFAGETAEAVLLELKARLRVLSAEAAELEERAAAAAITVEEATAASRAAELAYGRTAPKLRTQVDARLLGRLIAGADALAHGIVSAQRSAERLDAPLRARVDAGALRSGGLGDELRRLGAAEVGLRQELEEASQRLTSAEVEIARIDAETTDATRRLEAAGEVDPAEGDDRDELAAKVERLEMRRTTLGQVNPLAREEYDAEKERLTDLQAQREDLEKSLAELERLRADL
ncbi:MAG: Chromosome partition protein Smc, partial [Thermoleophilia bacterium]|nr:Chromosome partition protein Smc [Thermoleophilia bacterium]